MKRQSSANHHRISRTTTHGSDLQMSIARDNSLVIFDCDGVLVDSEVVAARVLARELAAIDFPLTAEECIARYTGISMPSMIACIEADLGRMVPADFAERVRAADAEAFKAELRAVPGVRDMLTRLAHPRCVASSGRLAKMRLTLTLTGLMPFFEPSQLFSAEMVAHGKPAPDLFLLASERMGISPERCVVIEDSQAGVVAALAAGMRVLGFAGGSHCGPGYEAMLRAAGAREVFADMAQLPRLLEETAAIG
jgi:HAD superfamily hydrolase (TIGR01509 family)